MVLIMPGKFDTMCMTEVDVQNAIYASSALKFSQFR